MDDKTLISFLLVSAWEGLGRGNGKKSGAERQYATFNRRMMAATIDSLLLLFTVPFTNWLVPVKDVTMQLDGSDMLVLQQSLIRTVSDPGFITSWFVNLTAQTLVFCLFSAVCWHFWSATPGKMLLRIKIVSANSDQFDDRSTDTDQAFWLFRIVLFFVSRILLDSRR